MVAILVTPPVAEPVTREEAKLHARIDGTAEDAKVDALIKAARLDVESRTGRVLVTQGWRIYRDSPPRGGVMRLSPGPVQSVDAVTVYGADGVAEVVAPGDYVVDTASVPGRLSLGAGRFWGSRALNGLEVDLTCGYGGPEDVPASLKQAVLMLVSYWYEQREAAAIGAVTANVASGVAALTAPYRMPRLS
ncbi:phage gp8 protein [Stappia sp. 22II-S9-Z10]|nr:phage gp8 protein [Stappia sp. 22II-S9-Z10]